MTGASRPFLGSPPPLARGCALVLAAACTAPVTNPPAAPAPADSDTGFVDTTSATPRLTPEEVTALIGAALVEPFPTPGDIYDSYLEVFSFGDEGCPGGETSFFNLEGCGTEAGWWFVGSSAYGTTLREEDGVTYAGSGLSLDMAAYGPKGEAFWGGGHITRAGQIGPADEVRVATMVSGSFYEAGNTDGIDPALSIMLETKVVAEAGVVTSLVLDGGATLGGTALRLNAVKWSEECALQGSVNVRGTDDRWYSLAVAPDCTGCGTVHAYDTGEALGEVCTDYDAALTAIAARHLVDAE